MYVPGSTGATGVLNVNVTCFPVGISTGPTTSWMKNVWSFFSVLLIVTSTGCPESTNETSPIGTEEIGGPSAGPGTIGAPVASMPNPRMKAGEPSVILQ